MEASGRSTTNIPIYVRKGTRDYTRLLSFQLPNDAYLQTKICKDVLNMGLAFDGNSILIEVTPKTLVSTWHPNAGTPEENEANTLRWAIYESPENVVGNSLSLALNSVQTALRDWLVLVGEKAETPVHVYFI